jgi:predicted O-methyltransferase YrrM
LKNVDADEIVNLVFRGKSSLMHRPALVHLCKMAAMAPAGMLVEIGVYQGSSLAALALAHPGDCIGVDDWSCDAYPDLRAKTDATLQAAGVDVHLMSMTSAEAARIITGPLAFVHIDANHDYEYIKQDIELWTPKLMSGGIAAFHDYGRRRTPGVIRAIDEWQAREPWACLGEVLTTIGYRKP